MKQRDTRRDTIVDIERVNENKQREKDRYIRDKESEIHFRHSVTQ